MNPKKMNPQSRHKARRYALQALYQWHVSQEAIDAVMQQYAANFKNDVVDEEYFSHLVQGVLAHLDDIDAAITESIDRSLDALTPIELSVLRLGCFELQHCLEVPYRVVINEALELTKTFGAADEGFKYVNAVLDKLAKSLRSVEM